ncbi:hypothetical protein BKA62DRAFT_759438, partial [Auriculariales sp. MPI-PUGE-AT-0066]
MWGDFNILLDAFTTVVARFHTIESSVMWFLRTAMLGQDNFRLQPHHHLSFKIAHARWFHGDICEVSELCERVDVSIAYPKIPTQRPESYEPQSVITAPKASRRGLNEKRKPVQIPVLDNVKSSYQRRLVRLCSLHPYSAEDNTRSDRGTPSLESLRTSSSTNRKSVRPFGISRPVATKRGRAAGRHSRVARDSGLREVCALRKISGTRDTGVDRHPTQDIDEPRESRKGSEWRIHLLSRRKDSKPIGVKTSGGDAGELMEYIEGKVRSKDRGAGGRAQPSTKRGGGGSRSQRGVGGQSAWGQSGIGIGERGVRAARTPVAGDRRHFERVATVEQRCCTLTRCRAMPELLSCCRSRLSRLATPKCSNAKTKRQRTTGKKKVVWLSHTRGWGGGGRWTQRNGE